jgi:hypothetical protein
MQALLIRTTAIDASEKNRAVPIENARLINQR